MTYDWFHDLRLLTASPAPTVAGSSLIPPNSETVSPQTGMRRPVRIPLDLAHRSEMISPTFPI
jgi:hypothetical protein